MPPNSFKFIPLYQTNIIFLVYHLLSIDLWDGKSLLSVSLYNTLGKLRYSNAVLPPRIVLEHTSIYCFKALGTLGRLILHLYSLSKLC